MKLKFKNQQFQSDAVSAVVDLFTGQEKNRATFSVVEEKQGTLFGNLGVGNSLLLGRAALLANANEVQKRQNLPISEDLQGNQFCVEMETGTGKTYVYTKTIFELNKRYGFTKFIIVVPSVAIREGVYKSFEITGEHFGAIYNNVPCRYFIYNSAKLSDVRQFATSSNIEIMIINIDAFRKSENIINQAQDRLNGETAMRYIQDTRPIVIIDEPQSVDNTDKSKEAIASLNPLCVFRYSATHRERINLLYRLTPVDAYQMGLVKQICVSSNTIEHDYNKPYIRLLSVKMDGGFSAKIEIDERGKDGRVKRVTKTVKNNSDLFLLSGERDLYEGYVVEGIDCTPGSECIEFTNTERIPLHKAIGAIDENLLKRAQIRRTIETHLDKELLYHDKGIKVLSLFFIDEVAKYRTADGDKGIYADMFEECYGELLNRDKYAPLKDKFSTEVSKAHDGYFSQDKKGRLKDTKGDTLDDHNTYNTIMKDKEWLLSFDCPLRFIWSHSALREGWDNPNVFQVCTLIEQKSTFTCRQKIGRGLRLCVNQDGERIEDKNINILHVMANESFAEFAETLQKEIEQETGVKFGVLQLSMFVGQTYTEKTEQEHTIDKEEAQELVEYWTSTGMVDEWMSDPEMLSAESTITTQLESKQLSSPPSPVTEVMRQIRQGATNEQAAKAIEGISVTVVEEIEKTVTYEEATELITHFESKGYISKKTGKIKDTMKNALLNGTLDLPAKYEAAKERFESIIAKADTVPPIRDASRDVIVRLKKQAIIDPHFMEIWDKIKQKTTYRVKIDSDILVSRSAKSLKALPPLPKPRILSQLADIDIQNAGVTHVERSVKTTDIQNDYTVLPDLLTVISEETLTPERLIEQIIRESGKIAEFVNNPQAFIENCTQIIRDVRHELAIDGISYIKLGGEEYYTLKIFEEDELLANLDKNAVAVENSVYDHIIYDSAGVEKPFAVALDNDPDVKMFFKLPERFKINTPIGTYQPDFAVYLDKDGEEKLYFILETKGSTSMLDLRAKEQLKIHCGKRHFEALDDNVELRTAVNWREVKAGV